MLLTLQVVAITICLNFLKAVFQITTNSNFLMALVLRTMCQLKNLHGWQLCTASLPTGKKVHPIPKYGNIF